MTEEQFCKNDSAFDGEPVDNINQIVLRSFNGEELKEYVEHHINLLKESDYTPRVSRCFGCIGGGRRKLSEPPSELVVVKCNQTHGC